VPGSGHTARRVTYVGVVSRGCEQCAPSGSPASRWRGRSDGEWADRGRPPRRGRSASVSTTGEESADSVDRAPGTSESSGTLVTPPVRRILSLARRATERTGDLNISFVPKRLDGHAALPEREESGRYAARTGASEARRPSVPGGWTGDGPEWATRWWPVRARDSFATTPGVVRTASRLRPVTASSGHKPVG
jgi:hypothetical protein